MSILCAQTLILSRLLKNAGWLHGPLTVWKTLVGRLQGRILELLEDFKQGSDMGMKRATEEKGPAWGLFEPNRP